MKKKAICLLSGGLDSTTALYAALNEEYEVCALTLDYGQLHVREIESAKAIAAELKIEHKQIQISLPWKGSSLIDKDMQMPVDREESEMMGDIPNTYVPARNSIFLSFAASYAEAVGAEAIFIGANALDYSGYPDCRPDYFEAFREMIKKGTKAGDQGKLIDIKAPLLELSKREIVETAVMLRVPLDKTWSCYQGGDSPCGKCDSCKLRAKGFKEAGVEDPILKKNEISSNN